MSHRRVELLRDIHEGGCRYLVADEGNRYDLAQPSKPLYVPIGFQLAISKPDKMGRVIYERMRGPADWLSF